MYSNDGPRTWKYAVPAGICVLLVVIIAMLYVSTDPRAFYAGILFSGLAVVCLGIAITNWWKVVTDHWEDLFDRHQAALSTTPLVLLSQNMKQMHPDAVKVLNRFGVRTTWDVTFNHGERDWILQGTNVHLGFVEWVLDHSGVAMYPKYRLSEGSKKWDPDGMITDREQYEQLELWLFSRLVVTRNHGDYKPPEFIPPWTPELIKEMLGMTGVQDLYQPEDVARQDLAAAELKALNGRQKAILPGDDKGSEEAEAAELTDEETAAVNAVALRNASQYTK